MEFLVSIEVRLPQSMTEPERTRLAAAEAERAAELAAQGTLLRVWRVPGRRANRGLWSAPDATALHAALCSLPLWPYLEIEVQALAAHPSDPGPR